MKKKWRFQRKHQRTENKRPLLESTADPGHSVAANSFTPDAVEACKDQRSPREEEVPMQELAEILGVVPHDSIFRDGPCSSAEPVTTSVVDIIRTSVSLRFPRPPVNLCQGLQQHLENVQETVCRDFLRLGPFMESRGWMGYVISCYHQHILDHLTALLPNIRFSQSSFVLMNWVLHTYLSQVLLGHPDLHVFDPLAKVDLLLLTEWVTSAKGKLLQQVQTDVRGSLAKILQIERKQKDRVDEESCIGFYVDTIQLIEAMPKEAQKISSTLSAEVWTTCYLELLDFLQRFITEQMEILEAKAKMENPEMMHFLKTLKICKELKGHVTTQTSDVTGLLQEIVTALDNMEAFTFGCIKKIVTKFAESHLKSYFRRENKQFGNLIGRLQTYIPKPTWCHDIYKMIMDEVYKLVTHMYLKCLIQTSQKKLTKHWSPDVGQRVENDAMILHKTISELAPGVQQWNLMLLKITELLKWRFTNMVFLTAGDMWNESLILREDLDLLVALLQWKGLSRWQVRKLLDVLPGQPRCRSALWCSCLT